MASIAAGSSILRAASCAKNPTASSFTSGSKARAARSNWFHPLAGNCRRSLSFNGAESSLMRRRRKIVGDDSTGLRSRGFGSESGCQFGAAGTGIASGGAGRRLSLSVVTQAGKGNSVPVADRILAALGYVVPFFDGIQYGRYFFTQFPAAEGLLRPLFPLLAAYKGFPYSNFIAFFSLYLLVVRNSSFSRYVRFNAMQAVVLDVLLILPTLVERTFGPQGGIGFQLLIIFYNTVFLFLVSCFLFGTSSCLLGKTPRLPIVADAADAQVEG